jgi:hypothetical protein
MDTSALMTKETTCPDTTPGTCSAKVDSSGSCEQEWVRGLGWAKDGYTEGVNQN